MKRGSRWLSVAGLLAIAGTGFIAWSGDRAEAEIGEAVRTAIINRSSVEDTVLATGVIRPVVGAEVNVGSRISGTVISLPVEVGDRVEIGQLLARLDDTALQAAADRVVADVALARPRVTLAESILSRRKRLLIRAWHQMRIWTLPAVIWRLRLHNSMNHWPACVQPKSIFPMRRSQHPFPVL